ncbi:MAG: hypothetical protein CMQ46_11930 [Gammaproteobacteria bacterium]|nr:hypothetical protein [Gammaproteobacteria bacterium]MBJ55956.1 hypothetical protein [Gammaproteobacteria bacterium]HBN14854.1 hypothetical protein [Pseudohongiella sp.]|tara:strand:+ start:1269 stop:2399 length:1131 start_codon:yes stop_codon:yes gene_type:complete
MRHLSVLSAAVLLACSLSVFSSSALAQTLEPTGPMPYDIVESWAKPFAQRGYSWGGNSGIHIENKDRIIIVQRGETELPNPIPSDYTNFPGSMGWNVIQGRGRTWQNLLYVMNSQGEVQDVWNQWDHLWKGTDGPGPHRLRVSPYDPERRIWVVEETGHVIYVFSQDGQHLIRMLGEKNVSASDETHFGKPQDVTFLPDGHVLVADGLENARVVILDEDGEYVGEFGSRGEEPGQFLSVHGIAMGPDNKVYVVDRDGLNIQVFQQTNPGRGEVPNFEFVDRWTGPNFPLDIIVSEEYAWVTDIRPPKILQFDLEGNHVYTWLLPGEGPTAWLEMHSFAVDEEGNLYGTDNQYARPQKLVPRADADPKHLVQRQYVP